MEVGCWAHARRRFFDARTSDPERAHEALARIRGLYAVESAGKDINDAARLALREERSVPLLDRLGAWLEEQSRVCAAEEPYRRCNRLRPVDLGGVEPIHGGRDNCRSTTTRASGP